MATGHETGLVLASAKHPNLKVVWDPANALVAGETPFPDGYRAMPHQAIGHVHAKDCRMENGVPVWVELGQGVVDWKGQLAALVSDGYRGWISLETHWPGPGGDKLKGSTICARNLKRLVAEAVR